MRAAFVCVVMTLLVVLGGAAMAAPAPGEPGWQPPVTRALLNEQIVRNDPEYAQRHAERLAQLTPLAARLHELQSQGKSLPCSAQILNETKWLLKATDNWSEIDKDLFVLRSTMLDPDQSFALEQEPHDGSWGTCYDEWFKKLDAAVNALNRYQAEGLKPRFPLDFLAPIATGADLIAYLDRIRINEIAVTGRDRRDELGAVASFAAELAFKRQLGRLVRETTPTVHLDQSYVDDFERFLDEWQDPETGYWGAWYKIDGRLLKATDLSFTYHIVAYRKGEVHHWDRIVATTLAIRDGDYPYGWQYDGRDNMHNAYDVMRILELGWPHLSATKQDEVRDVLKERLGKLIAETLLPDGSFQTIAGFDSSYADAQYFGVSLLVRSGYCSVKPPFWTTTRPPSAEATCCRIAGRLAVADQKAMALRAAADRLAGTGIICEGREALTLETTTNEGKDANREW